MNQVDVQPWIFPEVSVTTLLLLVCVRVCCTSNSKDKISVWVCISQALEFCTGKPSGAGLVTSRSAVHVSEVKVWAPKVPVGLSPTV